jgi:hypothetical protein
MHRHLYSAVFLLHAPAPAPIKICFGAVQCSSCDCVGEAYVGEFVKIRKINATLRLDNTIFKVIIAPTLKEFCFRVKNNSPPGYNRVTDYRKQISVIPLKSILTKLCI